MTSSKLQNWLIGELFTKGLIADPSHTREFTWQKIGEDRGFTGTIYRVHGPDEPVIVKVPDTSENFNRCAREALFFDHFSTSAQVNLPRMLASRIDASSQCVWIVLEDIQGREGDAMIGCDAQTAGIVLESVASMHAHCWGEPGLALLSWLPHWGQGQVESDCPHKRRVERFRKRSGGCRTRLGKILSGRFSEVITYLESEFESLLVEAAALPTTLIHADLHLDNLIWRDTNRGEELVILDWQSVSRGPALYDIARFLVESLHGPAAHDELFTLHASYIERLRILGIDLEVDKRLQKQFTDMILIVIAGFISAYGNEKLDDLPPRLQKLFHQYFTTDRLGGIVERIELP